MRKVSYLNKKVIYKNKRDTNVKIPKDYRKVRRNLNTQTNFSAHKTEKVIKNSKK